MVDMVGPTRLFVNVLYRHRDEQQQSRSSRCVLFEFCVLLLKNSKRLCDSLYFCQIIPLLGKSNIAKTAIACPTAVKKYTTHNKTASAGCNEDSKNETLPMRSVAVRKISLHFGNVCCLRASIV